MLVRVDMWNEPRAGTVEAWAVRFVRCVDAHAKLALEAPPELGLDANWCEDGVERRLTAPGRPKEWLVTERAEKAAKPGALTRVEERARMLHTFAHHELQAAELFAWALLAFPRTPRAFRIGLVKLLREEMSHLALYTARLRDFGVSFGAHPLRDWFWQRVAGCDAPLQFVALQGLGLEGANLEHAARWAQLFRNVGDDESAAIIATVEREEIGHVAFARHWFEHFSGAPLSFERWSLALPSPLTPALFHGTPLNIAARAAAGIDDDFLAQLERSGPAVRPKSPTP